MRKASSVFILALVLISFTPSTSLADADVQCFQEFARDMEDCSELATWWQRSLCGADAELELVGCIGREVSPWN